VTEELERSLLIDSASTLPEANSPASGPAGGSDRQAISVKRLFSDAVIFGIVGVFDRAIGFVLLPITTALMSVREYGVLSMYQTTTEIMQYLVAMGVLNSFFKHYAEETDDKTKREILNASFWQITLSAALLCLIFMPFASYWDQRVYETGTILLAMLTVPSTYLSVLISLGDSRLQADGKAIVYALVNMFQTATMRGLALFLLWTGFGASGWIIGQTAGQVASIIAFSILAFPGVSFRLDPVWFRRLFLYGIVLVPLAISHWSMQGSARFMMNAMLEDPKYQVGLYTAGERISQIMMMFNLAFVLGWRRFAFSNIHHADGPRLLGHGATVFFCLASFAVLGLISLGDDLTRLMIREEFWGGIRVIPYLTIAGFLWGVTEVAAISLYKANKTYHLSGSYIAAAVFCIVLNFVLIRTNGMVGAAQAWMCGEIAKCALVLYFGYRYYPISFQYGRILHSLAVYIPIGVACAYSFPNTTWGSIFAQMGLMLLVPIILLVTGFLDASEREKLAGLVRRFRPNST
jgi:O-antigen/teichoic acid export membrane protein